MKLKTRASIRSHHVARIDHSSPGLLLTRARICTAMRRGPPAKNAISHININNFYWSEFRGFGRLTFIRILWILLVSQLNLLQLLCAQRCLLASSMLAARDARRQIKLNDAVRACHVWKRSTPRHSPVKWHLISVVRFLTSSIARADVKRAHIWPNKTCFI